MTYDEIHDWFSSFYNEVIEGGVRIRNRKFCGAHLETFNRDMISIVMEQALDVPDGFVDDEMRANALFKNIFIDDRTLICDLSRERFEKIVKGEDTIREDEWFWSDEESPLDCKK